MQKQKRNVRDETIEQWLDQQIEYAENRHSINRSYRQVDDTVVGRLTALREVRAKLQELWGI